jgi:predicted Ser/Thr protein kinase
MPRCSRCGRRFHDRDTPCPAGHDRHQDAHPDAAGSAHRPAAPPTVPGYEVGTLLGRGGFGAVWLARDTRSHARVAIKVARDDVRDAGRRLVHEAEILARLDGDHAPALLGRGVLDSGAPYLVMQLLTAPSLASLLAGRSGPLPADQLGPYASGLVAAAGALHARAITHRDLKPENLFVGDGTAWLIDFGIATTGRLEPGAGAGHDASRTGAALGTIEYMAPEQLDGRRDVDARADVYSLGVILFEMLTGRPPFFGPAALVEHDHLRRRPPLAASLAPCPPALDGVLRRCLAKDPAERHDDALALARDLQRALAQPAHARAARAAEPAPAAGAAAQERLFVLLYTDAGAPVHTLQAHLASLGASLLDTSGARHVFAVPLAGQAMSRAVAAARALVRDEVCARVVLDVAALHVRPRRGGRARLLSGPLPGHALEPEPGLGVRLTDAARAAAGNLAAGPAPVLVGREPLLSALLDQAGAAWRDGRPALATVMAGAGHGKSALGASLVERLGAAPAQPRVITLAPGGGAGPRDADLGHLVSQLAAGATLDPRDEAALAWILGAEASGQARLAPVAAAPGALELAAVRAAGQLVLDAARHVPLAIVCDDVHQASGALLATLEYATRDGVAGALWVCVLGRPELAHARPAWGQRARESVRFALEPLDRAHVAALARHLLPSVDAIPGPAIDWLAARSHGVPLYLVELLRLIAREGLIRRRGKGESCYLATEELERLAGTPGARWLAERELDAMPPELAAHARLCALLGHELEAAELAGVLDELEAAAHADGFPLDARAGLRALIELGLLYEVAPGRARFRHALIRDAVAESVPAALRTTVHRAAARFHREHAPAGHAHAASERAHRLAEHAGLAGDPDAGALYLALAERARASHAYVDAETLYSRSLGHLSETDLAARARALHGRGQIRYRQDRYADAAADLHAARAMARAVGDRLQEIDIVLDAATALDWARDFAGSRRLAGEAAELAAAGDALDPGRQVRLDLARARSMWRDPGQVSQAPALLDRVIASAERLGDAAYEAHIIALLIAIDILPGQGMLDRAEVAAEKAIALASAHGDALHLGVALMNRRSIWFARNQPERILDDAARYHALGSELGLIGWSYASAGNRADALYQWGKLAEAWPPAREAVAWEEKQLGDHRDAALLHARMSAYQGDEQEARAMWQTLDPALLSPMGRTLYDLVDVATRDATDQEWDAVIARCSAGATQCEPIEAAELRGLWCARRGRREEATRWLRRAVALCDEIPGIMGPRVRRALAALDRPEAPIDPRA